MTEQCSGYIAPGATAAANGHYAGDDEYTVGPTAEAWRVSILERRVLALEQLARVNNRAIETLLAELATARSDMAALADRVAALELKRCVE